MDETKKNRLILRLAQDLNTPIATEGLLSHYHRLNSVLTLIQSQGRFFDETTLETDPRQYVYIREITKYCVTFNDESPFGVLNVDLKKCLDAIAVVNSNLRLSPLPKHDFYHRQITVIADIAFSQLQDSCLEKLENLMQPFLTENGINIKSVDDVKKTIRDYQAIVKTLPESNPRHTVMLAEIDMLNDWLKIKSLQVIKIPQENGEAPLHYCSLDADIGGVTKKVALVSHAKATEQLQAFYHADIAHLQAYQQRRADYALQPDAMVKLAKHDDILEVQHEMIALNFSRLLEHTTTRSTMVAYEGKPALFIPFDEIKLLSEYTSGQTIPANYGLIGNKTYTNYSTIDAVGEGLHPNQWLDDFGATFGHLYLVSDTDAIGGYAQNRAVIRDQTPYIFDTVMMQRDTLGINSRLRLYPVQLLLQYTRHGEGRNITVIDDSNFKSKFASIMNIINNKPVFLRYLTAVSHLYQMEIEKLEATMHQMTDRTLIKQLKATVQSLVALKTDAETLTAVVDRRIKEIYSVFPKWETDTAPDPEYVCQSLLLAKMLNLPRLYTDDGRPYRHPWAANDNLTITQMTLHDNNHIKLDFNKAIPNAHIAFIRQQLRCNSLKKDGDYSVIIDIKDLKLLDEAQLYREYQSSLSTEWTPLTQTYIAALKEAYDIDTPLPSVINRFITVMAADKPQKRDALTHMQNTIDTLQQLVASDTKHKGFYKHLLKKVYQDSAQYCRSQMTTPEMQARFDQAYQACATLDRLSDFHHASFKACEHDQLQSVHFKLLLNHCTQLLEQTTTHTHAIAQSLLLEKAAGEFVQAAQPKLAEKKENKTRSAKNAMGAIIKVQAGTQASTTPADENKDNEQDAGMTAAR